MLFKKLQPNSSIPIYQQLYEQYRYDILHHILPPRAKIDSINEIIQKYGVSRETAKLVLNMLAKQGLIIKRPGKGSFVAEFKSTNKIWGLILPFYSVQYEDLLNQLAKEAWIRGRQVHHFIDHNSWKEEINLVSQMISEGYEAIIVAPTMAENNTASFYSRISSTTTSIVLIDHSLSGSFFGYCIQSYDLGVRRGLQYLIEQISSKELVGGIAFVRNEVWAGRNLIQEMMEETYNSFIQQIDIQTKPYCIDRANLLEASFMNRENIKGLFCCDDTDAVRILGRLKEQGLMPGTDFWLVSYGNTDLARYFTPSITSVDPHNQEMAAKVAEIISDRLSGKDIGLCQYVVQPTLVIRET